MAVLAGRRDWQLAILAGMTGDGPQRRALERALPARWERRRGHADGAARREPRGRGRRVPVATLARAAQVAAAQALRAAAGGRASRSRPCARGDAEADALYDRIQAVEARSWKAREGVGISAGPMRAFYGAMLPRLCALGQQRTLFARAEDRDIGYILGAVFEGEYRGLQFSYDDDWRALGLGSLLQYHQIVALCDEGIGRYDLGTEMDYKRRWAEEVMETEMLVLVR